LGKARSSSSNRLAQFNIRFEWSAVETVKIARRR
jgi:hypothetical protein